VTVDIVMPVRDAGEHLAAAIDSVRRQTFTRWRLLAVDDGSTDGTPAFLRSIHDSRVLVLASRGRGIVAALNTGLEQVRAPYVARMDADDTCAPERLDRQLAVMTAMDVVAIGTSYTVIDELGSCLGTQHVPTRPADLRAALARTNPFCHGSLLMRADALRGIGGYREDFPLAEDYDLVVRLSRTGELANVDEPLYAWRLTAASSSVRRAREQARQTARVRANARAAGLLGRAPLRTRVDDLLAPGLASWERLRPPPSELVLARRRAGLRWGNGDAGGAIAEYDAVLRERPGDLAARLRRRRARAAL
jgi:glycosyltransferase involved in cell wall biosynthesis